MATVCIICKQEKNGTQVYDDFIIKLIRKLKRATNTAQNNKLVVCRGCMEEHLKRRKSFETWFVRYLAIGVIVTAVLVLLTRNLASLLMGALLVLFMLALAIPFYHPSLVAHPGEKPGRKGRKKGK